MAKVQKTWHSKHRETYTMGQRIADSVANSMGSWTFIIIQILFVVIWMALNVSGPAAQTERH
jgi:uncharacterized membrane protein